jgi:SagB-type dehydrogenase family enzyme
MSRHTASAVLIGLAQSAALLLCSSNVATGQQESARAIRLPAPRRDGPLSLEAALRARHSTRAFTRDSLGLSDAAQLLWAAQGVNREAGGRTAPSAGATYPLEIILLAGHVRDLPAGAYRYRPATHDLVLTRSGDVREELVAAALRQTWAADAALFIVFAAVFERTAARYGPRAERYVPMEVGHAAQNVYLQAAALDLGTTFQGAFNDTSVTRVLGLAPGERPLGLMPVGRPR